MASAENFDLHSHSTASDGLLSPTELVRRAHERGVTALALTDHDEVSGLAEAQAAADDVGIRFIPGVEISVSWGGDTIHIVGLDVDASHPVLHEGLRWVRSSRTRRAARIAEHLEAIGVKDALSGAMSYAGNPDLISRSHFARFMVSRGYGHDTKNVFQHYLVRGKPGYEPHHWANLGDAVRWIRASGGVSVVAHPGRYKLAKDEMKTMLAEFRDAGGESIEVLTGSHTNAQYDEYARMARALGFAASRGSDYHGPGESRIDLGALPKLPDDLKPVWDLLEA